MKVSISVNSYIFEKNRVVLTYSEHGINNLKMIGRAVTNSAVMPLETHIHPGCMEIVVLVKGTQKYSTEQKEFLLVGGDVFVSFTDQPHGSGNNPQSVNEIIWFQIDMNYSDGFLGLDSRFGKRVYDKLNSLDKNTLSVDGEGMKLIKDCMRLMSKQDESSISIAQPMLVQFINRLASEKSKPRENCRILADALEYINDNIEQYIDISTLSRISGLSESRFKHKFTEQIGTTPNKYINLIKIERAKQLLEERCDITETALQLGFNSSSYFAVVFKKFTGITPSEYRRSGGGK